MSGEKELFFLKETIRLATDLGARVVRVFASGMGNMHPEASFDQQWTWAREGLEEAVAFAQSDGVILGLQNHTPILQSYRNVLDMVKEIASDHLKVILDAPLLHMAGEPVAEAVVETGDLIVHSHTSDHTERVGPFMRVSGGIVRPVGYRAVALGDGEADLKAFVAALKGIGYRGYLSYEICGPVVGEAKKKTWTGMPGRRRSICGSWLDRRKRCSAVWRYDVQKNGASLCNTPGLQTSIAPS